jgi:hypothetical protein
MPWMPSAHAPPRLREAFNRVDPLEHVADVKRDCPDCHVPEHTSATNDGHAMINRGYRLVTAVA